MVYLQEKFWEGNLQLAMGDLEIGILDVGNVGVSNLLIVGSPRDNKFGGFSV